MNADERLALIGAKVERAKKHLIDLHTEIGTFLATNPYRVVEKVDSKHVYEISHVAPIPGIISAIAGDVIQNLRSALDHLANQLMLVRLAVATTDRESQFPIRDSAGQYEAALRRMKQDRFLRQDAFDALLRVQAYKRGNGHQLWVLHRLNNIDKHRIILTAGSAFRSANFGAATSRIMRDFLKSREAAGEPPLSFSAADIPIMDAFFRPADNMCPLKVGDILTTGTEMDPQNDFRFDVALNEPKIAEGKPILETLQHFADLLNGIVSSFRPCLT